MATSAFKSTTKRTPIGVAPNAYDSSSSNRTGAHRRSRSLSRFSHRLPAAADSDEAPAPRGRFVNTVRGSGFPEISLDDLAIELFESGDRGRQVDRRSSDVNASTVAAEASQRRGRSVSRHGGRVGNGKGSACNSSGGGKVVSDSNSRRRRSVSVVRYPISDSESDIDHSQNSSNRASLKAFNNGNSKVSSLQKPTASNHRRVLGRSLSQKDLLKSHDDHSSQSSALTDDEARDAHSSKNGIERTIRAVYAQKKAEHPIGDDVNSGLYEAMRKELRHAVEEIRTEVEQALVKTKTSVLAGGDCMQSNNSDVLQAVSTIRRNYSTKLEQSAKRKQDLLAEIVLEEQRGKELAKIVRELLPDPKNTTAVEKPSRARKRSNDKGRMSKQLTEEAEKYFEDFISNVEDTDISSLDGERSDSSSTLGGSTKPRNRVINYGETETFQTPTRCNSRPVEKLEMDGVVLPWLQWETSNDASPLSCKNKMETPVTSKTILWDAAQDVTTQQERSNYSASSRGSWSPGVVDGPSMNVGEDSGSKYGGYGCYQSQSFLGGPGGLRFDMDEYLKLKSNEDHLFERWSQQQRINTGGLLLCNGTFL
ncbi:hypothetical protein L1049_028429 [Liquidambar formosana]|uniref:Uncharacterized protein n=1 Tax=Liquidambar formosana TaxID=63359 RepID=A0AAP0RJN4_LIQFO